MNNVIVRRQLIERLAAVFFFIIKSQKERRRAMYGFYQQPYEQLIRVTGIDGAKAYQMRPNSAVALFDGAEDIFYLKSTDGAGFPTIRIFRFEEVTATPAAAPEYITKAEFEQFKEEFLNGQQHIQESEQPNRRPSKQSKSHDE